MVQIARHRQVQPLPVVLSADGIVIRGLRRQVLITQKQIGGVHIFNVAILLFLGRRRLETLTPSGSQTEILTKREHT